MSASTQFVITPAKLSSTKGALQGELRVPGDKSISHRSIMLASIAQGVSHISGFLQGEDSLNTLRAFRAMGVNIQMPSQGEVIVQGVGMHGLHPPAAPLYLGNSGTSMRLLSGLMAGQSFAVELTGDASLSSRPMRRVTDPLAQMGACVETDEQGRPPLKILPGKVGDGHPLSAIDYTLPMASAQVKSCVLLAGMYAQGVTQVREPGVTRDHTERMLQGFGYPLSIHRGHVSLEGGHALQCTDIDVPADVSSAAFFMVAASLVPGSDVLLRQVGVNPTRTGAIDILRLMGADIVLENPRQSGGEPIADIRVRHAKLKGITIPADLVPLAIDEFPVLFVAAANAEGETVLTGAQELRVKESDRIQAMSDGLQQLGAQIQPLPDGAIIQGGKRLSGGTVESFDDHRISMAFAVAGLLADGEVTVRGCDNVSTSFPGFVALAATIGMTITEINEVY